MRVEAKHRRLLRIAVLGLLVLPWIGVAIVWLLFEPTAAHWVLVITAAAVATEIGLYVGAALLGLSAFERIRNRLHLGRK